MASLKLVVLLFLGCKKTACFKCRADAFSYCSVKCALRICIGISMMINNYSYMIRKHNCGLYIVGLLFDVNRECFFEFFISADSGIGQGIFNPIFPHLFLQV